MFKKSNFLKLTVFLTICFLVSPSGLADKAKSESPKKKSIAIEGIKDPNIILNNPQKAKELFDANDVQMLIEKIVEGVGKLRDNSRTVLYELKDPNTDAEILKLLKKTDKDDYEIELLKAVGKRNLSEDKNLLYDKAKDDNFKVSMTAVRAIGEVGEPNDVSKVLDLMKGFDNSSQFLEVEIAAVKLAKQIPDKDKRTEEILKRLEKQKSGRLAFSYIHMLGKLPDEKGYEALMKRVDSDDIRTKIEALKSLVNWPNAKGMEKMRKLARTSENMGVRIYALRGFVKRIPKNDKLSEKKKMEYYEEAIGFASSYSIKKMIIINLGNSKSESAMKFLTRYLGHPSLHPDADMAILTIAEQTMCIGFEKEGKDILAKVIEKTPKDNVKKRAKKLIQRIEG